MRDRHTPGRDTGTDRKTDMEDAVGRPKPPLDRCNTGAPRVSYPAHVFQPEDQLSTSPRDGDALVTRLDPAAGDRTGKVLLADDAR